MWKPDQSLDDYVVRPTPEVASEPPRPVVLERTGEVEVLKPLTRAKFRSQNFRGFRRPAALRPLWFRRFLAVGSVALVMIALILVSAIFVGINDSAVGPDVAVSEQATDILTQPAEPFDFDDYAPSVVDAGPPESEIVRRKISRKLHRRGPRIFAARRPVRQIRQALLPEQPKFTPTTLVIYAENGVINTRIEPWFPGGDKRTPTYNN